MAEAALSPELALRYLDELSTDIRASVILGGRGAVAASSFEDEERTRRFRALVLELFRRADAAVEDSVSQVEVTTSGGAVFAMRAGGGRRGRRFTLAVVTGRFALPSLMFYDLRRVLSDLGAQAA